MTKRTPAITHEICGMLFVVALKLEQVRKKTLQVDKRKFGSSLASPCNSFIDRILAFAGDSLLNPVSAFSSEL